MRVPPKPMQHQLATVMIRAYATHSYLYYVKDDPIISDADFDGICSYLADNYEWVKPFDLNDYINEDALQAGTGYAIASRVCGQTKDYAESELKRHKDKAKKRKKERRASALLG